MRVIVIAKASFNTIEIKNVTNIAFSSDTYIITADTTYSYSANDYKIAVL